MAFATKTKPTVRRTKRVGSHHKQDKKYLKHYWPYLPIALVVGAGIFANSLWSHNSAVLGDSTALSSSSLLAETNVSRQDQALETLSLDSALVRAAQAKAQDMVTNNYWSHDTPNGETPWRFISDAGYKYQKAGENLAYGFSDSQQILTAWLNSPEHRANVLNGSYTQVGFGIAHSSDFVGHGSATVVVAMYGDPGYSTVATALPNSSNVDTAIKGASNDQRSISRVAVMSPQGLSATTVVLMLTATIILLLYVLTRHGMAWHKMLLRGEKFVLAHPRLDILLVAIITLGILLTKTTGFIL